MTERFWLLQWIDTNDIRSSRDIDVALMDSSKFQELHEMAAACRDFRGESPTTNNPIVAGRDIDLSGEPTGDDTRGLIEQVDQIFGTTWHYFDEIVVEGLSPRRFAMICEDGKHKLAHERARSHCQLLLHLRSISALERVVFRQKPNPCIKHGDDLDTLEAAGLKRIMANRASIVEMLSQGELLFAEDHREHFDYMYEHAILGQQHGSIDGSCVRRSENEIRELIASEIFEFNATLTAADIAAAAELCAPLAISSGLHDTILQSTKSPIGDSREHADQVAIEIGLPILHGVSTADLIKIREDEIDAFERFRTALRAAINEAIEQACHKESVTTIAARLVEEYVVPALHDIDQRLHVARKVLARKSTTSVAVGSAMIMTGLLAAVPLLLPAGIALAMATPGGVHYPKYVDERGQIELSDMYFLWRLKSPRS